MNKPKYQNDLERKEAKVNSVAKYFKKSMSVFTFRFHNVNDKEVIDRINAQNNKTNYIRQLILKDIRENGKKR